MFLCYYLRLLHYYCILVPLVVLQKCAKCIFGFFYSACCLIKRQRRPWKENLRGCIETSRDAGQGARLRRAVLPGSAYCWKGRDAVAQSIIPSYIPSYQSHSHDSQSTMTESNHFKRVTCKRRHPNQHIRELLVSLHHQAVQKQSNIAPSLREAISSLDKYPLPVSSGSECFMLKGFDSGLCKYIDLYFNYPPSWNKKTKISKSGITDDDKIEHRRLSPVKEISDSEITSKKNLGKNKKLETNTEKCILQSISETNNNTPTAIHIDDYPEPVVLDTYFVNKSREGSNSIDNEGEPQEKLNNFGLFENWESFANTDQECTSKSKPELRSLYQPIEVLDQSPDENSVTKINLTHDDESVCRPNRNQCLHNEQIRHCEPCDTIYTAANAYHTYFEEKSKRDAEEIVKIGKWTNKMYKPAYRSSSYAILVALLEQRNNCQYRDCLTKDELIQKAQRHTDQLFINSKFESDYTAWNSTKRLINKGMIEIVNFSNDSKFFYTLTAMGRAVAMELLKDNARKITVNDVIFHGERNDRVPSGGDILLVPSPSVVPQNEEQTTVCFIEMPPGTFEIILLIDKREHFEQTVPANPNSYCKFELRSLNIGDFLWVARSKKTSQELVLPYIVERKRMDDLASSIKDGRFHEQKFRLRKCGLKNVLYLVEWDKKHGPYSLPVPTLMQAVFNTSILEEFNIVRTDSWNHTFMFLEKLTEKLSHEYLATCLKGCNRDTNGKELMTFEFFNKFSYKNKPLTVRDTFIKMLLQLRGLSVEKALAITRHYSTPRLLMKAYEKCTTAREGELLLLNCKFNSFTQRVGPTISKTVYKLFSKGKQHH